MTVFVGIDLGTTFSAVAYINASGQPQIIPNPHGRPITPSVVELDAIPPLVGEEAKERFALGSSTAVAFFKRYMGDPDFQITVRDTTYTPVELSTQVLKYLKEMAEQHFGEAVTHAVITVPAYFNHTQREATIEAGRRAGLEVLSLLNEPTAAAFAYGMRATGGNKRILVYDLGGGTFDVTIVEITADEQRVIGTGGNHRLGGKDWDDVLTLYLLERFRDEFGEELVGEEYNALAVRAEEIKKMLTSRASLDARIQVADKRGLYTIERSLFENLTSHLLASTQEIAEQVLNDTHLVWADIDHVLLVGGATRMPMVKRLVEEMSGKPPLTNINPDEGVALGAAIQAAMDMARRSPEVALRYALAGQKRSQDVIGHSLGMIAITPDRARYINSIIIPKNRSIPAQEIHPYQLRLKRRGENRLDVYMTQGENDDPAQCAYLGKYVFRNIPALIETVAVLDVAYIYDHNGVVHISAVEHSTQQVLTLTVEPLPNDVPARFLLPPEPEEITVRVPLVIYMAFDLSGSMSGAPLIEAKKAAHAFVGQCDLSNTSIGIISFSDWTIVDLEACQDAKRIKHAIDNLTIGRTGGSNDADPFDTIYSQMVTIRGGDRQNQQPALCYALVLADGVWSHQGTAIGRAKRCHAAGIDVIGIGFGGADQDFLRSISSADELSFFTQQSALVETFSTIAQELTEGKLASGLIKRS